MNRIKKLMKDFLVIFILLFSGCSSVKTSTEQYNAVDQLLYNDNYLEAVSSFEKSKKEYFDDKDRVLYWTDLGLLNHYALQDSLAIINLQLADYAIEELYTKSISKGVTSMLLNDNALDYSGEDYENLYINVFKALSYYREGLSESALVEIRRLIEKFVVLERNYKKEINSLNSSEESQTKFEEIPVNFYSSALAHYISMILFYNDQAYDDARISKDKLYDAFDNQKILYNFPKPNLDKLLEFTDNSKLSFLTFLGRAPLKYEYIFSIDTYKNLVVISSFENGIWKKFSTINWQGVDSGIHAKFAAPKMKKRGSLINNVEIIIDGKHRTDLNKLESLENAAFETFKRQEALIYLKSLSRTIIKAIANETINNELDKETGGGDWGELTRLISGAIISATENADLRLTHYFPSFAYAGYVEVTPGIHDIEILYKDKYNKVIATDKFDNYQVSKTKNIDLIETIFLQ